jgi:hypothetical protein
MNTSNSTSEYLLLFRGTAWDRSMSPDEMQQTMSRFVAWFERLSAEGVLKGGQPLLDDARIISGKNGRTVTDGPFAESKEAVGGYSLITDASLDDAVAIARQCPILEFGVDVEVRPIAAECPTFQRVRQRVAEEAAMAIV